MKLETCNVKGERAKLDFEISKGTRRRALSALENSPFVDVENNVKVLENIFATE